MEALIVLGIALAAVLAGTVFGAAQKTAPRTVDGRGRDGGGAGPVMTAGIYVQDGGGFKEKIGAASQTLFDDANQWAKSVTSVIHGGTDQFHAMADNLVTAARQNSQDGAPSAGPGLGIGGITPSPAAANALAMRTLMSGTAGINPALAYGQMAANFYTNTATGQALADANAQARRVTERRVQQAAGVAAYNAGQSAAQADALAQDVGNTLSGTASTAEQRVDSTATSTDVAVAGGITRAANALFGG